MDSTNLPKKKKPPGFFEKGNKFGTGRPEGAYNEYKRMFLEIQKNAAYDADETYRKLQQKMDEGESWAFQIYYKELFTVPKRNKEQQIVIDLPETISLQGVSSYLDIFIKSLSRFESYTQPEVLDVIKTLSNVKIAENSSDDSKLMLTGEQLLNEINMLRELKAAKGV